jgi:tRNA-modifying protein YgfZ
MSNSLPLDYGPMAEEYRAAREGAALFDLSDRVKVEGSGPDARLFLHNLCTNDVKNLPVGGGCEAFLTTPKARVIAHLWIGHYAQDNGSVLVLDMAASQAEKVLAHLDHYLISEQVELANRTAALAFFRLCGPRSAELFASILGKSWNPL